MRRGITPVVAVVLLLMMTVGAAGGAYTWFSQMQVGAQERTDTALATDITARNTVCYTHRVRMAASNTGDAEIAGSVADIYLYRDGDLVQTGTTDLSGAGFMTPGGFGEITANLSGLLNASTNYRVELEVRNSDAALQDRCDAVAAPTCRDILTAGAADTDGYYDLDPDGVGGGGRFTAYCNMTGGGLTKLWVFPDNRDHGWYFTDSDWWDDPDGWGFGDIADRFGKQPPYALNGTLNVYRINYSGANGSELTSGQISALRPQVSETIYNGNHFHYDLDSPISCEPVGPYGCPDDTTNDDGGGGYVLFPSNSSDPATGAGYVISDNNNPHGTQGPSTDSEEINWSTITDGMMTHIGVQARSDAEGSDATWGSVGTGGSAPGILSEPYVWVK